MIEQNLSKPTGLPPGTLIYVGDKKDHATKLRVIDYNREIYNEKVIEDIKEIGSFKNADTVSWINVDGVHEVELVRKIGEVYELHPLLLEDIVNTAHRPKVEDHEKHLYFTFKMLTFNEETMSLGSEQVSIVLGASYVISFQETAHDIFDPVRARIKASKGRIRGKQTDYLVYALIDAVVDSYFSFLESYDTYIDGLEEKILMNPNQEDVALILRLKKQLLFLKRTITPLREAVSFIQNTDSDLLNSGTIKYFSDVHDHLLYVIDSIESNRSLLDGLMESFMSNMSNRMNEVMKVLTIIATIFIPLTFIAGIYGMNFTHMPELGWKYAYPTLLLSMGVIFVGMLVFFRKKTWL